MRSLMKVLSLLKFITSVKIAVGPESVPDHIASSLQSAKPKQLHEICSEIRTNLVTVEIRIQVVVL